MCTHSKHHLLQFAAESWIELRIFIKIVRLLKGTPPKILVPRTEWTSSRRKTAVSIELVAKPVSKSAVLILAAVFAAACVANVASNATTVPPVRVAAE